MSTKLSTDLHITRPTTRLHAPPGGATSFSFGDTTPLPAPARQHRNIAGGQDTLVLGDQYSTASKKVVAPVAAEPEASVEAVSEPLAALAISNAQSVGVVVAGEIGADVAISSLTRELVVRGVNIEAIAVTQCEDALVLPYLVRRVSKHSNFKVIIAVGLLTTPQFQNTLVDSLMTAGLESHCPIIPAVIHQSSLLEFRALVPKMAESWARSASLLLGEVDFAAPNAPVLPKKVEPVEASTTSYDVLMAALQDSLKRRGATGIIGLARKFKIADDDHSGQINLAEFTKCMNEHALGWTTAQIKIVFDKFDKDSSGGISFDEFLVGVRGVLNERRRQFVLMAYELMDADKSGVIELNDITAKYDGSKHPDVIAGKRTSEDVLREFMSTFDADGNGKVTVEEWCDYYSNVSASIDSDDYFELMMRNAWHISGGEGWCANSSCRRVLVTHTDGRQSVEEIKNDLGMKGDDKAAMKANLASQGINDIQSIDTKGSTEGETPAATPTLAAAGTARRPATAPENKRRAPGGGSSLVLG